MSALRKDFSAPIIARVDRDRRTAAQKARDARTAADARAATQRAILSVPASQIANHCEGALEAIRDALCAHLDPAGAASTFGRFASMAQIHGPSRKAAAEHAFARLTAANDGDQA